MKSPFENSEFSDLPGIYQREKSRGLGIEKNNEWRCVQVVPSLFFPWFPFFCLGLWKQWKWWIGIGSLHKQTHS